MSAFFKKCLKLLSLMILVPLVMIPNGSWICTNKLPINTNNLIAKSAITYNNLPIKSYGSTPWSLMQLDLQQYDVFQGKIVQRIVPQGNNIVLYATGNDDGTNTSWFEQDLIKDTEPYQILSDANLDWHYDVKIWANNLIFNFYDKDKNIYSWVTKNGETIASNFDLIRNSYLLKNYFIFGINKSQSIQWYIFNLTSNRIIGSFNTDHTQAGLTLLNDKLYFIQNQELYYINLTDKKLQSYGIISGIKKFVIINNDYLLYANENDLWFLHNNNFGYYKKEDQKIIQTPYLFLKDDKLFFKNKYGGKIRTYYLKLKYRNNIPVFSAPPFLWDYNVVSGFSMTNLNSNLIYYTGSYVSDPSNQYYFIQRWIEPNQDFNLSVAKIAGYGNDHKQATIDFNFNPNWQNKNYYLNHTDYYLNYWVDNKEQETRVKLQKADDNYRIALTNDDLINYDGKTLHTTISANVNGREINNIKLAQANGLFKYDDVNDTYDYIVKNYTPPYWTKARIVGLGVGCVLAIPFLVALFFWLKRQWHKIYF